ncbi:MAG: radical SAM protein [Alphaproteobacteria bacterium]|nr:radical SAM protein [Alphaproteobacteria bacterium]
MKIALIQTPWSDASAREYKGVAKRFALYPPMGLLCLAASVDKAGHESVVLDLEVEELPFEEVCRRVKESGAELIGITATSPVFHITRLFAAEFKKRLGLPIIAGGPHINVLREEAFAPEFDYAAVLEGHDTLVELMTALEKKEALGGIKGLLYRENGQVRYNGDRAFTRELDDLPYPARSKVNPGDYIFEVPGQGVIPVATIELTRGCPFKCVFCSEPSNTGRALRKRTPRSVVDEMLHVKEQYGISHFMTLDSTLTLNRKLIEGMCHELIARNVNVTWEGQTRANLVDEPLLRLMKRAGLIRLSFGVESADLEVLRLMKKEVRPEDMRNAFRLCKRLGISTLCGVMMGNPGDTVRTVMKTARFVRSIPEIRFAPMAIAIPYPGTELFSMAERGENGLKLLTKDYTRYSRYAGGVMEVGGLKPEDLAKLQRRALFIAHSTPRKAWGLVSHFGFGNVARIGAKLMGKEIASWFGRRENLQQQSAAYENTTLRSLGVHLD